MIASISGACHPQFNILLSYTERIGIGAANTLTDTFFCQKGCDYMAIIKAEKNNNYTVMSNYHLRDKNLTLKAKGLLSVILSLPEKWDYSIAGLVAICKESETAVKSSMKELKDNGYMIISKERGNNGQFEYVYTFYEKPHIEKPEVENPPMENPPVEKPEVENQGQLNTNKLNTKELNTDKLNKENESNESSTIRHSCTSATHTPSQGNNKHYVNNKAVYGRYNHVLLSDNEFNELNNLYGSEMTSKAIKHLDEYIESKNYQDNNHFLCIKRWVIYAVKEREKKENKMKGTQQKPYQAGMKRNYTEQQFADMERRLLENNRKEIS